jgi:hypothetical protein
MKKEIQPEAASTNRRKFFAAGARCLALGGIVSFAAMQEWKRRRLAGDPNCIKLETCSDCVELGAGCQKDKAIRFRAAEQK